MSVVIWPTDLPQKVLRPNYSEGFADGRLRTKTDTGPGKSRLRWAGLAEVACSLDLQGHKKAVFRDFWKNVTAGGTLPFFIPDQAEDGFILSTADGSPLTTIDGSQLLITAWWLAQFSTSPPKLTAIGGLWFNVAFALQVLP